MPYVPLLALLYFALRWLHTTNSFREIIESQDLTKMLLRRWPEAIIILDNTVNKIVRCIIDIPYMQKKFTRRKFLPISSDSVLAVGEVFFPRIFLHSENFDTFA